MSAAALPASTELLGIFVEAFEAKRYAKGRSAHTLRDRTARRCFAGRARTRQWCCRLTALLEFLRDEQLIVGTPDDELVRSIGLFLPFAATMMRWDSITATSTAGARAHLRAAAIELVVKLRLLTVVGFDFGIAEDPSAPLHWLDPAARAEPLRALRARAGSPSLVALADALDFGQHTVGRWFQGDRPSREALQVIARHFGRSLREPWQPIYRSLYWHYALADAMGALARWLDPATVGEVARVAAAAARCRNHGEPPKLDAAKIVACAMMPLPVDVVASSARGHGAGDDWSHDVAVAHADYERAGTAHADPQALLDFLFTHLPRRPCRKRVTIRH